MSESAASFCDDLQSGHKGPEKVPRWTPARVGMLAVALIFAMVIGGAAVTSLARFARSATVPGPNTYGEAGRVFFALRLQRGRSLFMLDDRPPYYPSVHGPLLHASVGVIGRVLALDPVQLYAVGRIISVTSTLVALIFCVGMLRHLGVGWGWVPVIFAALFCHYGVMQHTISYRPDNWVFALSAAACYLLLAHPATCWSLGALAVLPVLAYMIKAPGLWIAGAVVLSLWAQQRWRAGLVCALATSGLLAVSILGVQWASDGAFLDSFAGAMNRPYSAIYLRPLLNDPRLWLPLLLPLFVVLAVPVSDEAVRRKWRVVTIFWALALAAALATMPRAGSNTYYLIDAYAFGLVLTVAWLADAVRRRTATTRSGFPAVAGLVMLFVLLNLSPWLSALSNLAQALDGTNPLAGRDVAVVRTMRYGRHRQEIADRINAGSQRCFSDDPGLNILLDEPAVINMLVPTLLIQQGVLSREEILRPIRRQEYDLILLTELRWRYRGTELPPPWMIEVVKRHYRGVRREKGYLVFEPSRTIPPTP